MPVFPASFNTSLLCCIIASFTPSRCFSSDSSVEAVNRAIASLIFVSFDVTASLTDSPSLLNSLFSIFSVDSALSFSFFSNSAPVCKRLLIKCSFQPDILPAVRICNADTASRHPDHFQPRLSERLNHILTAFYLSGMVKCIYTSRDALSKRLFRFRQVIRECQRPAVLRGVRVMQPVMVIHQRLPGINSRPVCAVVVRLEAFSGL
ncbi:hypothetical protein ESCOCP332B_26125 [Escherichia coli]|nr:Uncharacterised protein [Escherichia coli]SQP80464.1 Uncharacterised protein [Escherichia coli]SQQ69363.1 Uncharacterised protein [Escherichia coli]